MKPTLAITAVIAAALTATAAGSMGGFAPGGGSSGRASGSHGSSRSGSQASARNHGTGRTGSRSAFARNSPSSAFRFTSANVRGGDPFCNFAPGSVLPFSMAGLGTSALPFSMAGLGTGGSAGACLAAQSCWNGRRFCFPNRFGSRRFGNGYVGLGGDYWGSDYDTTQRNHHDAVYQNEPGPAPLPATVPAAGSPPAMANTPPAVVSHEFAYGTIVTDVQNRLAGAGFYRGSVDGYLTAGTRTAIAMFQDSRQLIITGRIDAALLQALGLKP